MHKTPDPLRHEIGTLQVRRRFLESRLLQPQTLLAASLIERHLGSGAKRRASPAYYLSRSVAGRSKLTYVKVAALPDVRQQCEAHRNYQQRLVQWRHLTAELDRLWLQLQR